MGYQLTEDQQAIVDAAEKICANFPLDYWRPGAGIVEFETRSYNQDDKVVLSFRRTGMMFKKDAPAA